MILKHSFYQQPDAVNIAKELLGKVICTNINKHFTSAIIVETEAYLGIGDKASHAYAGRRTARNEVMYGPPGFAYVYLCYGIHHLFNVVTNVAGIPHAVLLRAVKPLEGESWMLKRRGITQATKNFTSGPGKLSAALGIQTKHNGLDLTGRLIWIEDQNIHVQASQIISTPRIGVDYAGADALLPYRFLVKPNAF